MAREDDGPAPRGDQHPEIANAVEQVEQRDALEQRAVAHAEAGLAERGARRGPVTEAGLQHGARPRDRAAEPAKGGLERGHIRGGPSFGEGGEGAWVCEAGGAQRGVGGGAGVPVAVEDPAASVQAGIEALRLRAQRKKIVQYGTLARREDRPLSRPHHAHGHREIGLGPRRAIIRAMPNAFLEPVRDPSAFRRIAAVAWDPPREPAIFGSLFIDAGPLLAWLERWNARGGERVTVTHAVARAAALTLQAHPEANALVRNGRLMRRRDIDLFVHVALPPAPGEAEGRADLSGVLVRHADSLGVDALAAALRSGARRLRAGEDPAFQQTKAIATRLPGPALRVLLWLLDHLQWTFNLDTGWLGAPRDPFGSALVTSVGMLGLRLGWAPFFPLARNSLILLVGAVEDAVVARDGVPVVVPQLVINATVDHRVLDGFGAARVAATLRALLEDPSRLGEPPAAPAGAAHGPPMA